ncbi:MAG: ABC-F family ATP-binding cassette domain-containing protein [Cyanobacteriota bacterium]|nr:ABC-F family ATP-binding cassette domain-containing protein [Cyanobacteriota bacterium]
MTLIRLEGAGKDFGVRPLFRGLDLTLEAGDRLGLIGPNGAGKSTLLRVLAGVEPLGEGLRFCQARLEVVLLNQEPAFDPEATVLDQVFQGAGDRMTLLRDYERLSLALSADPGSETLLSRLSEVQRLMEVRQAWDLERHCHTVLDRLGIGSQPETLAQRMGSLSGGNRRRVALAAALVAQPDVLLLDEPTNHLDAEGVEWLQSWLDRYPGAVVLVTHDRYLLDRVTRRIVAVEGGEARHYPGNYAAYLERRAQEEVVAEAAAATFRSTLRRELAWLRQGPKARGTKQKARLQRIEALRERPAAKGRGKLELATTAQRLGKRVIRVEEMAVAVEGRTLLRQFSYDFSPEDRVGIIGPNGAGKSTLLEVLAGRRAPSGGFVEIGETVRLACFDQHSALLQAAPERKVIDVVQDAASRVTVAGRDISASQLLERFLFPPAQQHQPVAKLSGGERRRLHLCRLLMAAPNVLLLDEPTNDLDVATLAVLEDFLEDFPGCVVVVSHDRWFLDRTVDRLFVIGKGAVQRFEGNYSAWLESRQDNARGGIGEGKPAPTDAERSRPAAATAAKASSGRRSYKESRELEALERDLPQWENQRRSLEERLALPDGVSYGELERLSEELAALVTRIHNGEERWLQLSERPD